MYLYDDKKSKYSHNYFSSGSKDREVISVSNGTGFVALL